MKEQTAGRQLNLYLSPYVGETWQQFNDRVIRYWSDWMIENKYGFDKVCIYSA